MAKYQLEKYYQPGLLVLVLARRQVLEIQWEPQQMVQSYTLSVAEQGGLARQLVRVGLVRCRVSSTRNVYHRASKGGNFDLLNVHICSKRDMKERMTCKNVALSSVYTFFRNVHRSIALPRHLATC